LVNPFREDGLALIENELMYTIRFQNTGNDYARHVIIKDTIDANLDMSTFDIINSSHPDLLQVSITDDRAVAFEFKGIYLPDSTTNEPASHGFINYSIKPNEGVPLNTEVNNTAYIYFDFNPAIVTNTTESIMVDEFPISKTIDHTELTIESYPNPTSDFIYLSSLVNQVRVYDLLGNLVIQKQNTDKVQVHSLEVGSYFVEYEVDGIIETDRWVIVK